MRPRHSHEHNHHYPRYQRTNLDEEDDGYNGSSDNADDDCDEDVKTLHISATSTRLERRKHTNTGKRIWQIQQFDYLKNYINISY